MGILDRIVDGEWVTVHTSDLVIAEALNYIQAKIGRKEAAHALRSHLFGSEDAPAIVASVLRTHSARFAAALDRYTRHFDAGLSFTDWASLVAMEDENIRTIATFDAGFHGWAEVLSAGSV